MDLGFGFIAGFLLGILANDDHRLGQVADFVATAGAGNFDIQFAGGHFAERAVKAHQGS